MIKPFQAEKNQRQGTHLIIIGAPKSGTTWLRDALAGTPGFWLGGRTETHYFDRSKTPNASEYSLLFRTAPKNLVTVDVTPDYLICPEAMGLMPSLNEALDREVKLVVLLREPARRSFSHYQMLLDQGRTEGHFLENFQNGSPAYEASRYGYWLTEWYDKKLSIPLRAFLFDDLVREPEGIILAIIQLCNMSDPNSKKIYLPQKTNLGGVSRTRAWPLMRRHLGFSIRKLAGEHIVLALKRSRAVRLLDSLNKRRLEFSSADENSAREALSDEVKEVDLLFPELEAQKKWGY